MYEYICYATNFGHNRLSRQHETNLHCSHSSHGHFISWSNDAEPRLPTSRLISCISFTIFCEHHIYKFGTSILHNVTENTRLKTQEKHETSRINGEKEAMKGQRKRAKVCSRSWAQHLNMSDSHRCLLLNTVQAANLIRIWFCSSDLPELRSWQHSWLNTA